MILFSMKENFADIANDYLDVSRNYYFVGTHGSNQGQLDNGNNGFTVGDHLIQIGDEIETEVNHPGICMQECEQTEGCNSIEFKVDNDGKCKLYRNKIYSNLSGNINSCADNTKCHYNRNNNIFVPYDDRTETNRYRKNISPYNPNELKNKFLKFVDIRNNDQFIKQCSDACNNEPNCQGFNLINNPDNYSNSKNTAKFKCQLYNTKRDKGTSGTNNLNRDEMFASYDKYNCGELDIRNKSDSGANKALYCNNELIEFTSGSIDTKDFSDSNKDTVKNNLMSHSDEYVCLPRCDSGGLTKLDNTIIPVSESNLPQIFTL